MRSKICGITTSDQAIAIADLGVDAIGINFWPGSKRFVDPEKVGWLRELGDRVIRIGVFVNESPDTICQLIDSSLIDWAQLHGDETPEELIQLQKERKVFKALGIKDRSSLDKVNRYDGPLLIDAYAPVDYGGTGETMDWMLGKEATSLNPDREIILAGGLTPANVEQAIAQVGPTAVDVASGVEVQPGIKDLELCRQFIERIQSTQS